MLNLKPRLNTRAIRLKMVENYFYSNVPLANTLGVTRATISLWLEGNTMPSDENLIALASALKCEVRDIVILPDASVTLPPVTEPTPLALLA